MDYIKLEKDRLLGEAEMITNRAEREQRALRPDEKEQLVKLLASAQEKQSRIDGHVAAGFYEAKRDNEEMRRVIENTIGPGPGGGQLGDVLARSGWHPKQRPSITLPMSALGFGAKITAPSAETWSPAGPELRPTATDQRFIYPNLRQRDAAGTTAVADIRETASGVTGAVERAIDAVTDKAVLDLTLTSVVTELRQFAIVIESIPAAILESVDGIRAFFDNRGRYEIQKAIDAHVVATIIAANPDNATAGANTVEDVRNALALARANGANPTLLALDPTDAALLDLTTVGADGLYLFGVRDSGSSTPLWGVRVVESPAMIAHDPLLIDPDVIGVLYMGTMKFDADPYTGFKQNTVRLRVELTGLMHVRNVAGAVIVGTESP